MSDNIILQTLAKLSLQNIAAISDLNDVTVKDIIHLPVSRLKDIIWFKFISLLSQLYFFFTLVFCVVFYCC